MKNMNEDEIIAKLKKIDDIEPRNENYYDNLKKRLVNLRKIEVESGSGKVEPEIINERPSTLFTNSFVFGILSIFVVVIVSLVMIFGFSYTRDISENSTQSKKDINESEPEFVVNGNPILSTHYVFEDLYVELELPEEWTNQNQNYDLSKFEFPKFVNSTKELLIAQISDENLALTMGMEVTSGSILSLASSNDIWDMNYDNVYIAFNSESNTVLVFSSEDESDVVYFETIVDLATFTAPFSGWNSYSNDSLGLQLNYPDTWKEVYDSSSVYLTKELENGDSLILEITETDNSPNSELPTTNLLGYEMPFSENDSQMSYWYSFSGKQYKADIMVQPVSGGDFLGINLDDSTQKELNLILSSISSNVEYFLVTDDSGSIQAYYPVNSTIPVTDRSELGVFINLDQTGESYLELSTDPLDLFHYDVEGQSFEYEVDNYVFSGKRYIYDEDGVDYEHWDLSYSLDNEIYTLRINFKADDEDTREVITDILERVQLNIENK